MSDGIPAIQQFINYAFIVVNDRGIKPKPVQALSKYNRAEV